MTIRKTKLFSKFTALITAVALVGLSGCSSTPKKQAATTNQTAPIAAPVKQEKVYSSDEYLQMAKANQDSPSYLHKAAQKARDEQNPAKSLVIIQSSNVEGFPLPIQQQMLVLEVANLIDLNHLYSAEQKLNSPLAAIPAMRFDIARLKAQLFTLQNRLVESLQNLFILEKAAENKQIEDDKIVLAQQIWQQLNLLPNVALSTFDYEPHTNAKSWLELATLTRLYTGQPTRLQQELADWYKLRPWHAGMEVLPESFQRSLQVTPFRPQKIAVILPYTGRLRKQAQAIRNGLLMANQDKTNVELIFIDSESPITTIEQRLNASQAEFVIGPLHKDKVTLFSQNPVISALPTLFLNRINIDENPVEHHFYFGLTPEDEAEQAAKALFKRGYKKPSIIAPRNRLGQRLSDKFSQTWLEQLSPDPILTPEVTFYANQKEMQKAVNDLMDVKQSKDRIKKLRRLINRELKTESRNRKDLDVIYIIGNNVQTKLLKPLIEVNTSPFTKPIPVYATSRSHGLPKANENKRDLRSLTFTEIPWMLQSDKRYAAQRRLFDQIWPEKDESLRRLFALGYDALYLVDSIAQLRVLNGLSEQGMSGKLSVDANGFVTRLHQWAEYNESGEVTPAVVD